MSLISIHAQFILHTQGNTGYWSLNWPDLNCDFLQWGGEYVLVPELVGPVGGMSDLTSMWKDLVAKPCDSLVTEASMLLSFPLSQVPTTDYAGMYSQPDLRMPDCMAFNYMALLSHPTCNQVPV